MTHHTSNDSYQVRSEAVIFVCLQVSVTNKFLVTQKKKLHLRTALVPFFLLFGDDNLSFATFYIMILIVFDT